MYLNNKHRYLDSIKKLVPMVNVLHSSPHGENVQQFHDLVEHHIINYGEEHTIKLVKSYRLYLQQIALKQDVEPLPFCKSKRGFPTILKPWELSHDSSIERKRHVMSTWRIIDTFRVKPEYNVSTITTKVDVNQQLIEDITCFISSWDKVDILKSMNLKSYLVMSNKAGPNGPASITCIDDLKPLRANENLYQSVKSLIDICLPGLIIDRYEEGVGKRHSKLVLLSDKAGKTRIIAIADWWSNVALSGLHKNFMKFLTKLNSDVTYRQDKIPSLVKGLGSQLYSADMTAFTDVFPIELEETLVKAAYGAELSGLWRQVISNREFYHPIGCVKYASGNPMGLLSSWPISTATHHAVKHYCAHKVYGDIKYKYIMLGDDSMDSCEKVHKLYLDTMNSLGVSTSLAKCTSSKDGYAEFAKRLFSPEGEITGLPVNLLSEIHTKPEQFIELLRICRERGYQDKNLVPGFAFLIAKNKSSKLLTDILSLPSSISGTDPLLDLVVGSWGERFSSLSEEDQNTLVSYSRDYIFWKEAEGLIKPSAAKPTGRLVSVEEDHPLLVAISNKLMSYLQESEDEYSIYHEWMDGNYREMAQVPSIDTYRYLNKGHKVTKCKYEVIRTSLALANGDCNILLHRPSKLSNFELFARGFPN